MTDFLSLTERGLNQPVVTRYEGMFNRVGLSAPFGTNLAGEGSSTVFQIRSAVVTLSATTVVTVLHDGIYRSTDSGATFSLLQAFSSSGATTDLKLGHGGLHDVYDPGTGERYLAGWQKNAANNLIGWRYRLSDGNYAEATGIALGAGVSFGFCELAFGTTLHVFGFSGSGNNNAYSFDVVGLSWSTNVLPVVLFGQMSLCIAPNGQLYGVGLNTLIRLIKFDGAWSLVDDLESGAVVDGNTNNNRFNSTSALFSDGTDLYAIYLDSNAGGNSHGFHVTRIPAPYDGTGQTEISATVLPTNWINSDEGGLATNNPTKRVFVVQDTSSGSLVTYLMFSDNANPGTPFAVYKWNGPASQVTFVGSGGAVRDSIPTPTVLGGGNHFYTPGAQNVKIVGIASANLGETVSFVCSGGGTMDVAFLFGQEGQAPVNPATLVSPVTGGGVLVGNTVTGCVADGVTVHTVKWSFLADSVSNSEPRVVLVATPA